MQRSNGKVSMSHIVDARSTAAAIASLRSDLAVAIIPGSVIDMVIHGGVGVRSAPGPSTSITQGEKVRVE